jgi:pfkB family carbohydrate kinase
MTLVVTLGEILIEILATELGQSFRSTGTLTGPYPSGAPAIFIDQVAKLGHPCGMIGRVGDDDFGWLNVERLRRDGVDVQLVSILKCLREPPLSLMKRAAIVTSSSISQARRSGFIICAWICRIRIAASSRLIRSRRRKPSAMAM